ncbi:MAG: hypothetical protein WC796_02910 [Candidatus Pacearchaeota archaeon]
MSKEKIRTVRVHMMTVRMWENQVSPNTTSPFFSHRSIGDRTFCGS